MLLSKTISDATAFLFGTRLKLATEIQYSLNSNGSTPSEVMGVDNKSTLKPALESFADDVKRSSVEKLEELISLQQQSSEMAAKIEGKRKRIDALQFHINEVSAKKFLFLQPS